MVRVDEGPLVLVAAAPQPMLDLARLSQPVHRGRLAVVTTDHDWRVFHVTAAAASLLAGGEALRGAALLGLVHPLDAGSLVTALASAKDDKEALSVDLRLGGGPGWREVGRQCPVAAITTRQGSPACSRPRQPQGGGPSGFRRACPRSNARCPRLLAKRGGRALRCAAGDLSPPHWDIVARLMGGQTIAEVAEAMFLSPRTVRNHLSDVYRKFGVHTQAGLLSAIYAGVAKASPPAFKKQTRSVRPRLGRSTRGGSAPGTEELVTSAIRPD